MGLKDDRWLWGIGGREGKRISDERRVEEIKKKILVLCEIEGFGRIEKVISEKGRG